MRSSLLVAAAVILSLARPGDAQPVQHSSLETGALSARAGSWDVSDTFHIAPNAAPEVTNGLIADRRMVGSHLEEILHRAGDDTPLRIDYLGYDATAGQWDYVSIEARIPVAVMKATSAGRDDPERVTLRFEPFAAPPITPAWDGRFLRMKQVIAEDGPDHEIKDQYFTLADGSGIRWLAHRYDYRRRR